MENPYSSKQCY